MRGKIREKLANVEFVDGVGHIPITVEEATKIQQIMFDMDDLKEKMTRLTLMIEEKCAKEKDEEIYELSKEIYLQHLVGYEEEEFQNTEEEKEELWKDHQDLLTDKGDQNG